ncbi:thioredoxin-related transmembrane protein 1-like [Episyrphus balteatus]|uniref:thioredoxin-related transmembrane protein 1-like n=1 Tax=Episyrphus balteatus TaxID=286459 RepID=UPI0024857A79|nr:thioredoxin-related transmembrane protein 1-like [Episyrphus balteatus]
MANLYFAISFFIILCAKSANLELIELNETNWKLILKGEWMVEFYAPWCPACKTLSPIWNRFAENAADAGLKVAHVDVTKSPSLSGRFLVNALPTIYHAKEGQFRQYRNSRDDDAFMSYVKQKEWQKSEPISSWKNPNSIHMTVLSYFFKLSHLLKDFNISLQEDYGFPTWASYSFVAIATIFVGATLGLLLVLIVDILYPIQFQNSVCEEKSGSDVDDDEGEDDESETEVKANSCSEPEDIKLDEAKLDSKSNKKTQKKSLNTRKRNKKSTKST